MMKNITKTLGLASLLILPVSGTAQDQAPSVRVEVGAIASAKDCTLYEGVRYNNRTRASGSSSARVSGSGASASSRQSYSSETSFETFFIKDCKENFAGLRDAIQAALASAGPIAVGRGGYVLTGRVENAVPTTQGFADTSGTGQQYGSVSQKLKVTMSLKVLDSSKRVIFGAPIATEIETGYASSVRGGAYAGASEKEPSYSFLQRQLAMVAARAVAFHFKPLVVQQVKGNAIQLNYGAPLLEIGALINVTDADGFASSRFRVSSVNAGTAVATPLGDASVSGIAPGSAAMVIEKGDPAENQSNFRKVELP